MWKEAVERAVRRRVGWALDRFLLSFNSLSRLARSPIKRAKGWQESRRASRPPCSRQLVLRQEEQPALCRHRRPLNSSSSSNRRRQRSRDRRAATSQLRTTHSLDPPSPLNHPSPSSSSSSRLKPRSTSAVWTHLPIEHSGGTGLTPCMSLRCSALPRPRQAAVCQRL